MTCIMYKPIWQYYQYNLFYNSFLSLLITSILYGFLILVYAVWGFMTCCWTQDNTPSIFKFTWINFFITLGFKASLFYSLYLLLFTNLTLLSPFNIMYQFIVYSCIGNDALILLLTITQKINNLCCKKDTNNSYHSINQEAYLTVHSLASAKNFVLLFLY